MTNANMHWTHSKCIAHRAPQQGNQLLISLRLWTRRTQLIKLRSPKNMHISHIGKSVHLEKEKKKKSRKKGQSTLIWPYNGSIPSHVQEYLKPTVSLNSSLYQLQYYIFVINSTKNYLHSFWTILCMEYFRDK